MLFNFRDMGGYTNEEGLKMKKGCFYRGGTLKLLEEEEEKYIDGLGLKHIFDLRSEEEINRDYKEYVPEGCTLHQINALEFLQGKRDDLDFTNQKNYYETASDWLAYLYKHMPFDSRAYKEVFEVIRKHETPFYFHCAAGKDRTGVLGALIMWMLDVDRETIYEEYMKSYDNMAERFGTEHPEALTNIEWIKGTFESIDQKYDSKDEFFLQEFGIGTSERESLKKFYLEQGQ